MPEIVFLDPIDLHPKHRTAIAQLGEVTFHETNPANANDPTDETELRKRIAPAEIAVPNFATITAETIQSAPNLQYIVTPTQGVNHVNLAAATARNIPVLNCPGYSTNAVAEHTMMLILACLNKTLENHRIIKSGEKPQDPPSNSEILGKNVLIIGNGRIGERVAELLAVFKPSEVTILDSKASPSEIDEALQKADIVTLHLPLNEQSHKLIDARRLGLMRPGAYLINTARGAVVDELALHQALINGQIAGAGLDVFSNEPAAMNILDGQTAALVQHPNVIPTSHTGYYTNEAIHALGAQIIANIKSCLNGKPQNVVNPKP